MTLVIRIVGGLALAAAVTGGVAGPRVQFGGHGSESATVGATMPSTASLSAQAAASGALKAATNGALPGVSGVGPAVAARSTGAARADEATQIDTSGAVQVPNSVASGAAQLAANAVTEGAGTLPTLDASEIVAGTDRVVLTTGTFAASREQVSASVQEPTINVEATTDTQADATAGLATTFGLHR